MDAPQAPEHHRAMNRLATSHRITWLSIGRFALAVVLVGLVALSAVSVMAMSSWLVDTTPP